MNKINQDFVLQVSQLGKQYKNVRAVHDVSFNIERGDIFAFLGPNGAGKTTTLRILLDIIKADTGTIFWNIDGDKRRLPLPSQIGYLPEERGLYPDLPVIRSLVYLASIRGMEPGKAKVAAMRWLEKLELADRAKEKLQTLSKGNQQKIQFVAAILHQPAFAILDEPFSGLDPLNQENFIGIIKELNSMGTTILLSAHQMQLIEKIADKVFLINRGKEIFNGRLEEILERYGGQQSLEISFEQAVSSEQLQLPDDAESISFENEKKVVVVFRKEVTLNRAMSALSDIPGIVNVKSHHYDLHDIFLKLVKKTGDELPATD